MAKKAKVWDGANWQELATAQTDLTNYANLNTTPISGFRNAIINGGFSINQRGSSSYSADGAYTFDRWQLTQGNITSPSVTRTANVGESGLPESIGWYASLSGTNNASTGYFYYGQAIEDVKTFAGQTITVSFYAKGSVAGTIGTRMNQSFGTGGTTSIWLTSSQGTTGSSHSITTSWQRYSVQYTVPSVSGKTINDANSHLGFSFGRVLGSNYTPVSNFGFPSSLNYTGTLSITGVQVEVGSIPTLVERRPIVTELPLCQRYYEVGVTPRQFMAMPSSSFVPSTYRSVYYKVNKRISNPVVTVVCTDHDNASGNGTVQGTSDSAFVHILLVANTGFPYNAAQLNWNSNAEF
jgi:hypothetical protein